MAADPPIPKKIPRHKPRINPQWGNSSVYTLWSRKWVSRNFWRVREVVMGRDDALQECAAMFAKCRAAYLGTVSNEKHFMSLFIVSVIRRWTTLAAAASDLRLKHLPHGAYYGTIAPDVGFPVIGAMHISPIAGRVLLSFVDDPAERPRMYERDGEGWQRYVRKRARDFGALDTGRVVDELKSLFYN